MRLVDEESLEAAEMLRIVVKSYKHAIYVGESKGKKAEETQGQESELTILGLSSISRRRCKHIRPPLIGARCS